MSPETSLPYLCGRNLGDFFAHLNYSRIESLNQHICSYFWEHWSVTDFTNLHFTRLLLFNCFQFTQHPVRDSLTIQEGLVLPHHFQRSAPLFQISAHLCYLSLFSCNEEPHWRINFSNCLGLQECFLLCDIALTEILWSCKTTFLLENF